MESLGDGDSPDVPLVPQAEFFLALVAFMRSRRRFDSQEDVGDGEKKEGAAKTRERRRNGDGFCRTEHERYPKGRLRCEIKNAPCCERDVGGNEIAEESPRSGRMLWEDCGRGITFWEWRDNTGPG